MTRFIDATSEALLSGETFRRVACSCGGGWLNVALVARRTRYIASLRMPWGHPKVA